MSAVHDTGDDLLRELAGSLLFQDVDLDSIATQITSCAVRELAPGETLIRAGQANAAAYIVLSGAVRVETERGDIIATLGPGQCVGELSLIEDKPATASVVSVHDARLLEIGEAALWGLVETSHRVARNLLLVLAGRLRHGQSMISEGLLRQEYYRQRAFFDGLTGVYNRRWLDETLPRLTERAELSGEGLVLLMIDADRFKEYNDRHGHLAGDHALQALARRLQRQLRPQDIVARYGGEEFTVLLPGIDRHAAAPVAERLRAAVAETPIEDDEGTPLPALTISIGVAEYAVPMRAAQLVEAADQALYRAKQAGRDRVAFAPPPGGREVTSE